MSDSGRETYIEEFLREARDWIRRSLCELERGSGDCVTAASIEPLLAEIRRWRGSLVARVRLLSDELGKEELIELHSELHRIFDEEADSVLAAIIDRSWRSLADQAMRDLMTGLLNRSAFERYLSDEIERARRYGRKLSLILLDIDSLKEVNDIYGHPAGDRALIAAARVLRSSLRQSDLAFRYGGDEFAAICPETSGEAIFKILQRIESNFSVAGNEISPLNPPGISAGFASYPDDAREAGELVGIADQRLYVCKREHHRRGAGAR